MHKRLMMREDFDKLAELFMSGSEIKSMSSMPRPSTVEVVLPGVLPPGGHVWFAPYASALAETCGQVAFVTLTSSKVEIEVFGKSLEQPPREADLKILLPFLATKVDHWLVAPSSDVTLEKILETRPDRLTILGEAHPTALDTAVETIDAAAEVAAMARIVLPRIGVAFLGSQTLEAQDAIESIERAVGDALGVPVEFRGSLPKLVVPNKPTFTKQVPVIEKFDEVIKLLSSPSAGVQDLVAGGPSSSYEKDVKIFRDTTASNYKKVKAYPGEPAEPNDLLRNIPDVECIEIKDSLPIGVELGVDHQGQLHLISEVVHFQELVAAESWIVRNINLVSKVSGSPVAIERGPFLHLVTDDPLLVTTLYQSAIFLHLAVEVKTREGSVVYRTPLNNPVDHI